MNSVRMQTGCLLTASLILGALIALSVHPWPAAAWTRVSPRADRLGADILDAPAVAMGARTSRSAAVAVPPPLSDLDIIRPVAEPPPSPPDDVAAAFRACALKAVTGDFGTLRPWQLAAYERGLAQGVTTKHVRLTCYGPWEGYGAGAGCAHGYGCSEIIAAASALPARRVIWIPSPAHLRVVGDTGAAWNDPKARSEGCAFWVDLWIPFRGWHGLQDTVYHRAIAVLP